MTFLTFFVVVMIVVGAAAVIADTYYVHELGKQLAEWQKVARRHGLAFTRAGRGGSQSYVTGIYRGCAVELRKVSRGGKHRVLYTQVRVTAQPLEPAPANLSPAGVMAEFTSAGSHRLLAAGGLIVVDSLNPASLSYEESHLITDPGRLQRLFDLLVELAAVYPRVVALGGEATPALTPLVSGRDDPLHTLAVAAVKAIAETTADLEPQAPWLHCPRCLARFGPRQVNIPWGFDVTYYGCRLCGQSREWLRANGPTVAVLDQAMAEIWCEDPDALRINWLQRRDFDFDEVEIRQATDEEVERFAIQVGNDTDPARQPHYKTMLCTVSAGAGLSENTLRVLRRSFGEVVVGERENTDA